MRTFAQCLWVTLLLGLVVVHLPGFAEERDPTLDELLEALDSDDKNTRKIAVNALARRGPSAKRAEAKLWTQLHSESDPSMWWRTAKALFKIIGRKEFERKLRDITPEQWVDQLSEDIAEDTRNRLESILLEVANNPNRDLREGAISATHIVITDPKATEVAVEVLASALGKDENPKVRTWAAFSLANYRKSGKAALLTLLQALDDPDQYVRQASLFAITEIAPSNPAVVSKLHRMLLDSLKPPEDLNFALSILRNFYKCGASASDAAPDLLRIASDDRMDLSIRKQALSTLRFIPPRNRIATVSTLVDLLEDDDVRRQAAFSLQNAATHLPSDACEAISPLRKASVILRGRPDLSFQADETQKAVLFLENNCLEHSTFSRLIALARRLKGVYDAWPPEIKIPALSLGFYSLFLLCVFNVWLLKPATLAAWAMRESEGQNAPPWKALATTLGLISWAGHSRRALDKWLEKNNDILARRCFDEKQTVAVRRRYTDLGHEADLRGLRYQFSARQKAVVWIVGPGGCGKSTLAFEIARRWRLDNSKHPCLPIVVEEDWPGSLSDHLCNHLEVRGRRPTTRMLRSIAYGGRILIVIDGLSERRTEDAQESVVKLFHDLAARNIVVTSRGKTPDNSSFRQIEVGPLEDVRLTQYVQLYCDNQGTEKAVRAIRRLSQGKPISPLFAYIAARRFLESEDIPMSYPELIHDYVLSLRPKGRGSLSEDSFLRAARQAATLCVEDLTPRSLKIDFLCGALHTKVPPFLSYDGEKLQAAQVVDQMIDSGLLERFVECAAGRVRFVNEPVAEYLATMEVASTSLDDLQELRARINNSSSVTSSMKDAVEQVEAVYGSSRHKILDTRVGALVPSH